jgi:co-chaperonin GroES (HSP10)
MIGKAIGEYVLIKQEKVGETKTESGLIIPADSKQSNKGTVESISENVKDPGFKEGDTVVFSSYSRDVVMIDDEEFLIMPFKDIKMVLK